MRDCRGSSFARRAAALASMLALLAGLLGCGAQKIKYSVVIKNDSGQRLSNVFVTLGNVFGHRSEEMDIEETTEEFPISKEVPDSGTAMWRDENGGMRSVPIMVTSVDPKKFDGILEISIEADRVTVRALPKKKK